MLSPLSFRDWLTTCPSFGAAPHAVLLLEKYASPSQKRSGVEICRHLLTFQDLVIHDSLLLKSFLAPEVSGR